MKKYLIVLLSLITTLTLFSKENEFNFSPYTTNSQPKVFLNRNIEQFCQRINLAQSVELIEIELGMFSNQSNTTAELRIYGEEGQQSVPRCEIDLIEPIQIIKSKKGFEKIKIKLDSKLLINDLQFFISISKVSNGLYLLTDDAENINLCENKVDIFTGQYLKNKQGNWEYTNFNFDITLKGVYKEDGEQKYFFENITDSLFNAEDLLKITQSKKNNLTVFDINADGRNEIIVNNIIYSFDLKNQKFKESNLSNKISKKSILNYFSDFNYDGKIDLLQIEEDSLDIKYKKYELVLYSNFNNSKSVGVKTNLINARNITSVQMFDLNNDNYIDFVITQSDSVDQLPNLVLKNNGKSFTEVQIYDNKHISYNGLFSIIDEKVTKDKIAKNIIISDNSGNYETWEIKDNFKLKIIQKNNESKNKLFENDSTLAIMNDYDLLYDEESEDYEIITANKFLKLEKKKEIKNFKIKGKNNEEKYSKEEKETIKNWCIDNSGLALADIDNNQKRDIFYFVGKGCYNNNLYLSPTSYVSSEFKLINRNIVNGSSNFGKDGIFSDYNEDGNLDIFTFSENKISVLKNTNDNKNNWIIIKDKQNSLLKNGDNVKLYLKNQTLEQEIVLNNAWFFQSPNEIHFGLGDETKVDSVIITDNKGRSYLFKNLEINKVNYLPENRTLITDLYRVEFNCYPNPFSSSIKLDISANIFKNITISIEDINGNEIKVLFKDKQKNAKIEIDWDGKDKNNQTVNSGIYFVDLKYKNSIFSHKIVKN